MRREGEPGKTHYVRDIRWNQLPYMAQQRVGRLETQISTESSSSFDVKVTIGYESANGGPSVPSLRVESCDLHGNSIVPTSKSVPPGCGHNRVTVQIAVFDSYRTR